MENERHTGESSAGVALYIRRHPGMSTQEIEAALGISFDPGRFGSVAMPMDRVEYRDGGWWPREQESVQPQNPGSGFARIPQLIEATGTQATRQAIVDALKLPTDVTLTIDFDLFDLQVLGHAVSARAGLPDTEFRPATTIEIHSFCRTAIRNALTQLADEQFERIQNFMKAERAKRDLEARAEQLKASGDNGENEASRPLTRREGGGRRRGGRGSGKGPKP